MNRSVKEKKGLKPSKKSFACHKKSAAQEPATVFNLAFTLYLSTNPMAQGFVKKSVGQQKKKTQHKPQKLKKGGTLAFSLREKYECYQN